jgi:hypothetical protein
VFIGIFYRNWGKREQKKGGNEKDDAQKGGSKVNPPLCRRAGSQVGDIFLTEHNLKMRNSSTKTRKDTTSIDQTRKTSKEKEKKPAHH